MVQGVSQKMLTQTLRGMERDGLISRTIYAEVPPRVEYALTPLGEGLTKVVANIRLWAYDHMDEIDTAREEYDQKN
jgi:DNA-binding HxlR family transcriptional regulator